MPKAMALLAGSSSKIFNVTSNCIDFAMISSTSLPETAPSPAMHREEFRTSWGCTHTAAKIAVHPAPNGSKAFGASAVARVLSCKVRRNSEREPQPTELPSGSLLSWLLLRVMTQARPVLQHRPGPGGSLETTPPTTTIYHNNTERSRNCAWSCSYPAWEKLHRPRPTDFLSV